MDTQLRNCKRKLTMFCKKLEKKVLGGQQEEVSQYDAKTAQHELTAVETIMRKVEEVQQEYANMLDRAGDTASTSEQTDYDQYTTMVEGVLSTAFDYVTELQCHLQVMTTDRSKPASSPQPQLVDGDQLNGTSEAPRVQLPPVPIPVFSGSIWEWENFWTLFQANVHSQPVPDLIKFNHLINALHGEPRQAIARFQVTGANYQKAVDFLRTKYSDREALVHQLIAKLESATSPSQSIKDQRQLLDNLQVIMSQLRDIGEQIDSQWLIKQVLTKFPLSVQREILKRKCSKEEPFLMQDLLDVLDKHILCEEKIALFTSNDKSSAQQPKRDERPARGPPLRKSLPCMYCGQPHKSTACTRYTTAQQRAAYLREHKLCLICASPRHTAEECKRRNCFECQGRHHTSCCLKARVASSSQDVAPSKSQRKDKHPSAAAKSKSKDLEHQRPTQQPVKQFVTHCLSDSDRDTEEDAESIAEYHSSRQHLGIGETHLPIGELLVLDPSTRELRRVAALLDSGAECSFIDQQLAEELHLPAADASTLQLRTFGAEHHLKVSTRRVPLDVWDHEGNPFQLQLLTHTTLTSSLKTPPVLSEDVDFIKQKGLNINLVKARKAKPKILIGSDQLWQLMDVKGSPIRLPSGLYLLPTRLGQLLTGQLTVPHQKLKKESTDHASIESMSVALCTTIGAMSMDASKQLTPEQAAGEEYWRLQDEGQDSEGNIREAVATPPPRRDFRRPVNLLVPLELETSETTAPPHHVDRRVAQQQPVEVTQDQQPQCPPRHPTYNLRKKDRVDYARLAGNEHCVTLMLLQMAARSTTTMDAPQLSANVGGKRHHESSNRTGQRAKSSTSSQAPGPSTVTKSLPALSKREAQGSLDSSEGISGQHDDTRVPKRMPPYSRGVSRRAVESARSFSKVGRRGRSWMCCSPH